MQAISHAVNIPLKKLFAVSKLGYEGANMNTDREASYKKVGRRGALVCIMYHFTVTQSFLAWTEPCTSTSHQNSAIHKK